MAGIQGYLFAAVQERVVFGSDIGVYRLLEYGGTADCAAAGCGAAAVVGVFVNN